MKNIPVILLACMAMLLQFCEKTPPVVKIPVVIVSPEPLKWRQLLDTNNVEIIQPSYFSIGDRGYTINPQTNEVYEYNATSNKIIKKNNFPGPRRKSSATAFAIGDRGYYGLGLGQISLKEGAQTQWNYIFRVDLWQYNPADDSWIRKADCPIPPNEKQYDPKQAAFFGAYGIVINNKAYIGSGRDINSAIRRYLYEYVPQTDIWNAIVKDSTNIYPPGNSSIVMAFSTGNRGYIGNSDTLWEFDPLAAVKWKKVITAPGPVREPVLCLGSATKGYVFGSLSGLKKTNPELSNDFYEFTPNSSGGVWKKIADFKGPPRASCPGFILNNRIYIGFGSNLSASVLTDLWEYMPGP